MNEIKVNKFLIGLVSVLSGLFIAMILLLITGRNPLILITQLLRSFSGYNFETGTFNIRTIGNLLGYTTPLIFTGLAVGFAFRSGLFNIGAEGQYIMGYVGAVSFAIITANSGLPTLIHLPLTVLVAIIFGAIWGFVPGLLKAYYNTHEVVTTIMLNYVAMYFGSYILINLPGSNTTYTKNIPETASLKLHFTEKIFGEPIFEHIFGKGTMLNAGIIIAILCIIIFYVIMERTSFGYELRAVGLNRNASKYAGINVKRNIISSMMISGAFAGLAGATIAIGYYEKGMYFKSFSNFGFDGIAIALVGGNSAFGILFSALLFGGLRNSMPNLQSNQIPMEIAEIIISVVVTLVAMQYGVKLLIEKIKKNRKKVVEEVK